MSAPASVTLTWLAVHARPVAVLSDPVFWIRSEQPPIEKLHVAFATSGRAPAPPASGRDTLRTITLPLCSIQAGTTLKSCAGHSLTGDVWRQLPPVTIKEERHPASDTSRGTRKVDLTIQRQGH